MSKGSADILSALEKLAYLLAFFRRLFPLFFSSFLVDSFVWPLLFRRQLVLGRRRVAVGASVVNNDEGLNVVVVEANIEDVTIDIVIGECLTWNGDTNSGMTASNKATNNSRRHIIVR